MFGLLGIVLSAAWLAVAYLWLDSEIGLDNWSYVLLPETAGQYVAGLLAPLVLIWVLMGFLRGPRGLGALRDDIAALREELAERARRDAVRPRGELTRSELPVEAPVPLRRPLETVPTTPVMPPRAPVVAPVNTAVTPPPAPSMTPAPLAPPPTVLASAPLMAVPSTPVVPLPPLPPSPTMSSSVTPLAPLPPAAPDASTSVTSLAQEVARTLGRLATDPVPSEATDAAAALDEEFRLLTHKVGRDLNAISMDLSAVLCRKSARDEALKAYNRGHKEAFHVLVRDYLSRHDVSEIRARLTQADAQSLLHTYAMKFASLIDEAARRDASGTQEQSLRSGAMGMLYEEVQRHTQVVRGGGRP